MRKEKLELLDTIFLNPENVLKYQGEYSNCSFGRECMKHHTQLIAVLDEILGEDHRRDTGALYANF